MVSTNFFMMQGFNGMFLFILFVIAAFFFVFIFWIWTMIDVIKREFDNSNERIIWLLLIIFIGLIPSILYYFMVMKDNNRGLMKMQKKIKRQKKKR